MIAKNAFQYGVLLDQLSKNNVLNVQETGNPSVKMINGAVFWLRYSGNCRERDGDMLFSFSSREDDVHRIRKWLDQYEEVYLALVCHTALYREVALLDRHQLNAWADFLEMSHESLQVFVNKAKPLKVGSLYNEITFMIDKQRPGRLHLPLPQSLPEPKSAAEKPEDKEPVMVHMPEEFVVDESILTAWEESDSPQIDDAIRMMNLESENKLLRKALLHKSRQLDSIQHVLELLIKE